MTVEQPPHDHLHPSHQDHEVALRQLKEITGVEDSQLLQEALEASRVNNGASYDIYQAISLIIDSSKHGQPKKQRRLQHQENTPAGVENQEWGITEGQEEPQAPAAGEGDEEQSSGEKEDDLQKAIALSLQDQKVLGGQVTMEDQDISRVLEASLAESTVGVKRQRGEVWQDPLNPHERKRAGETPVGLKNVGNTCWFSSVMQSLFHLPIFRRLVLNFTPKKDWSSEVQNTTERRNILFMQEMRKLFALMVKSKRKYVDPSQAVDILREAFPPDNNGTDNQQDVSEFSHKLLEWLEEAFELDTAPHYTPANGKQGDSVSTNPMLNLFYGHFKSEGHNDGHFFSNDETFGQYPLRVNNFSDIHDSLQAAMVQEMDASNTGQESWFTQLPPVLLFNLSRFQFNQHLGRPEKIHNKLEFHPIIYMDRYMEYNKNKTRTKREQVRNLKEQRQHFQSRLEKYVHYGSGPKRVPLQDVLQYTLEFVESKTPEVTREEEVENMETSPAASRSNNSPCSLHVGEIPAPRHISDSELAILQSCLQRWRHEVESDVKELQDKVTAIDFQIKDIYNEPSLKQVPYRLHAVLVHEGQAASGHYWAYVLLPPGPDSWVKFNDVQVTRASWAELQKESMGGHHHASAYCLVYVDARCKDLFADNKETDTLLPSDLEAFVEKDNALFQQEIEAWDKRPTLSEERIPAVRSETGPVSTMSAKSLRMMHAASLNKVTVAELEQAASLIDSLGVATALEKAVEKEKRRLQELAKKTVEGREDRRLHHIAIYMMANENTKGLERLIQLAILDQFAFSDYASHNASVSTLQKEASQLVDHMIWSLSSKEEKDYEQWHQEYDSFQKLAIMFVLAIEKFFESKFQEALPYILNACSLNEALSANRPGSLRGLSSNILYDYRRKCLLHINEAAARQFEAQNEDLQWSLEALAIMSDYVVPSMEALGSNTGDDDTRAAEEIRNRWCSMLGDGEIHSQKQEKLQEFLTRLLDPGDVGPPPSLSQKTANLLRIPDLENEYLRALQLATSPR